MIRHWAPEGISFSEDGEAFEIGLTDCGSLSIANFEITVHGQPVTFKTTYNSKSNYPLFAELDYTDYEVFNEDGTFTTEFADFCATLQTQHA